MRLLAPSMYGAMADSCRTPHTLTRKWLSWAMRRYSRTDGSNPPILRIEDAAAFPTS